MTAHRRKLLSDVEDVPLAAHKHWRPVLCRLRFHRWEIESGGTNQLQWSRYRCSRCGKGRRS